MGRHWPAIAPVTPHQRGQPTNHSTTDAASAEATEPELPPWQYCVVTLVVCGGGPILLGASTPPLVEQSGEPNALTPATLSSLGTLLSAIRVNPCLGIDKWGEMYNNGANWCIVGAMQAQPSVSAAGERSLGMAKPR